MNAVICSGRPDTAEANKTVLLNSSVSIPRCPLMENCDDCDVPFLRSLLSLPQRNNCSKGGKCIVREVDKVDGKYSIVTMFFYHQVQRMPLPFDKIQVVIDKYCATHNV